MTAAGFPMEVLRGVLALSAHVLVKPLTGFRRLQRRAVVRKYQVNQLRVCKLGFQQSWANMPRCSSLDA